MSNPVAAIRAEVENESGYLYFKMMHAAMERAANGAPQRFSWELPDRTIILELKKVGEELRRPKKPTSSPPADGPSTAGAPGG